MSSSQPNSRQDSSEESDDEKASAALVHRLSEGFIPGAATIHAIRKKREMARKIGGKGGDYVSLEENKKVETAKGKSRLVREDDNDRSDSGQEDNGAMRFGRSRDVSTQMQVLTALENVESDEDEDMKRWEEEQINKGAKLTIPTTAPHTFTPAPSTVSAIDQSFLYGSSAYPGSDPGAYSYTHPTPYESYTDRAAIPDKLVPITVENLKGRLGTHLRELKETYSGHQQRLQQIDSSLETAQRECQRVEGRSSDVALEYRFYQELKGYLRDLLSCLAEKVGSEYFMEVFL